MLRTTGSWHDIRAGERTVPARLRGRLRLEEEETTHPIAVGDHVRIRLLDDGTAVITERLPRRNRLSRRAAGRRVGLEHVIVANVDRAFAVQAVRLPRFNPGFVNRLLVMAEWEEIPAAVILNKIDLLDDPDEDARIAFWENVYRSLGYPVHRVSATESVGLAALEEALADRVSVLSGPSGVGKSTLLNALYPDLELRTGDVSAKTRKGRHTTTFAELLPLPTGGYVADTPGLREFGIWNLEPVDLSNCFVEMRPYQAECRFQDCLHAHEPDCAVKAAVDAGEIYPERYASYLNILDSLDELSGR